MRRGWLLSGAAAVAMAALAQSAMANEELLVMQENPANWVMPLNNYSSTRYSELGQINKDNVGDLQVAWTFSTGVLRGHEGGPLVIGDIMYIHTPFPNIVYALDLNDPGRVIWKYEPQQDPDTIPVMCCDTVNRGPAYAEGKIFLHQADTTLVALDAQTGEVVWTATNGDPKKGETGTSAPMVIGDKVLIGISGGEFGVQGHVTAYNINDGKMVWRGYSTGPDDQTLLDPAATTHLGQPVGENSGTATWEGEQWKLGGGTTWGWMSYDPELNLVYYGSGNPGTWNPTQRPGDNRWSMTIFARNPETGVAKWVYQMTPHDEWDYDGVNEMILVDKEIDGQERKLLVHFDRNGFGYTLDRETGELLVAEKYDPAVNWATHVDMETGRPQVVPRYSTDHQGADVNTTNVCPAALGTKDQQPAAYSPRTGLFYVPTNHVCMDYEPYRGLVHGGAALRRRDAQHVSGARRHASWQLHRLGRGEGRDRVDASGAVLGVERCARDRWRRGVLRHAGRLPEGGRRQYRAGAVPLQDPVRDHRQRQHLDARRQAVCRRALGDRRLGRHRPRGRPDRGHRGSGRGRRVQGAVRLHPARRRAHGVHAALTILRLGSS